MYRETKNSFGEALSTTLLDHEFNQSFDLANHFDDMYRSNQSLTKYANLPVAEKAKSHICQDEAGFPMKNNTECLLCSPTLSIGSTTYTEKDFPCENSSKDSNDSQSIKNASPTGKTKNSTLNTEDLKKIWTEKDYEALMEMAIRYRHNWKKIAKVILDTTNIKPNPQALQRIHQKLIANKGIKRAKFTHEDDLMIVKYYHKYGLDWVKIASHFTDKTHVMRKNRFYSYIKKKGMIDNLSDEVECFEEEIEVPEPINTSKVQQIKNLMSEEDDTALFYDTFHDFKLFDNELHDRVTEMSYQADSELFMSHFTYSERQDSYL